VAELARLQIDRAEWSERIDRMREQLASANVRLEQLNAEWADLWQRPGITPGTPREMTTWLPRHVALVDAHAVGRKHKSAVSTLVARIEEQCALLRTALEHRGIAIAGTARASCGDLLRQAKSILAKFDGDAQKRQQLERDLARLQGNSQRSQDEGQQATNALSAWQSEWCRAIAPLGLSSTATPAQASAVLEEIHALFEMVGKIASHSMRLDNIERDAKRFAESVQQLARRLAPELVDKSADAVALELHQRLGQARTSQARIQDNLKKRADEEARLQVARTTVTEMTRQLNELCREAGCDAPEQMPAIEQQSAIVRQAKDLEERLRSQLRELSAPMSVDEFIAEVGRIDRDALPGQLQKMDEQICELTASNDRLAETIGSERSELARMAGSAAAAEEAEKAQSLLAKLANDAETYARLRLASAVLRDAIARYRDRHQGPVLRRASELFATLTAGSFQKLQIEIGDDDRPKLVGIRQGSGATVPVTAMSDGSADQLYLALRIASMEFYLDQHEPLPFIVDDVLVHFDDERAVAALKALAELARKTQVIFFTHHDHLVKLAQDHLGNDLFIHELDSRIAQSPSSTGDGPLFAGRGRAKSGR
jgi:uncharacterized protein YhaN